MKLNIIIFTYIQKSFPFDEYDEIRKGLKKSMENSISSILDIEIFYLYRGVPLWGFLSPP